MLARRLLGPIVIGNDVTIGANAVMLKDAPDGTVWAGVPAREIVRKPEGRVPLHSSGTLRGCCSVELTC